MRRRTLRQSRDSRERSSSPTVVRPRAVTNDQIAITNNPYPGPPNNID
ncbi:MAG: hypothetical protein HON70_18855 [Lentisphaerae bacterium]|nr:hypothetical protein [Lentisphaerota bacterium]